MTKRIIRGALILAIAVAMATSIRTVSSAAEFTADFSMKGGMSGQGKVWVKDQKMKQEIESQMGKVIMIMDLNQGYNWLLMPDTKSYIKTKVETKGKGFRPENFMGMQHGELKADIKKAGTEDLNGYKCDKYIINFGKKEMGTMTQWFAVDLGYPIKIVNSGTIMGDMTTEVTNIKEGDVNDAIFQIPSGYTELKQPAMPKGAQ